jgi:hypothetical protein
VRPVTGTAIVVHAFEQGQQLLEILEAGELGMRTRLPLHLRHGVHERGGRYDQSLRTLEAAQPRKEQNECRTGLGIRFGERPGPARKKEQ